MVVVCAMILGLFIFESLGEPAPSALTLAFFPRLNLLSDTRILLLYLADPVLMFRVS